MPINYDALLTRPAGVRRLTMPAPTGGDNGPKPPQVSGPNDIELLRQLADALPSSYADDYETWLQFGMAVKTVDAGPVGLAIFERFSQRSGKYVLGEPQQKWESFGRNGNGRRPVTIATVIKWAKDAGIPIRPASRAQARRTDTLAHCDTNDDVIPRITRATQPDCKPTILLDTNEYRGASQTIEALAADPDVYQRGGRLVRVLRENHPQDGITRRDGSSIITLLPQACLRERMTKFATFVKCVRKGDGYIQIPAHPTPWLVGAVDARGDWPGVRHLMGISDVPILRPDGTLWQTPGYDAATSVLFLPSDVFPPIAAHLTRDDGHAALANLMEIVADFPFESDDHHAAWLAALLTPIARHAFDGPAPLSLIDSNVRGAGKGLLAQVIGQIALGREMPVSSYSHDTEEMRKKITAIALAGDSMVNLDNLEGRFGNDAIDRALTSTKWKDRILGKSELVDLPLLATWYATGNNVLVAADTARRIIHIRLDVLSERPEERTGFRHPDLIGWVKSQRPQLLASALTILVAYCNAGRPNQDLTPFGSFEGWSSLVRSAVVWVGLPDPCRTRTQLADHADTTADTLTQLLRAWQDYDQANTGLVVSEVMALLYPWSSPPNDENSVAMRAALENLVGCPPGKVPTPRQIGNKLRYFRRRVVGCHYLDNNPNENSRHGAVWRLHTTEEMPNV